MPFTVVQFFDLFARYNTAIWPLQWVMYGLGFAALALMFWRSRAAGALVSLILALMWTVNAIGYHWMFFATINPAARVFAGVFMVEALFLLVAPLLWRDWRLVPSDDARSWTGAALALFAVAVYPLWGIAAAHFYPALPMFGVAPCPTVIFTLALLLFAPWHAARWLLAIPILWAGIGGSAAILLGVPQDYGLIAAGLIVLGFAYGHWRGAGFARHRIAA